MPGGLPENVLESIAVANAKSVGEQPAILANIALANLVANVNLAQQNALSNIQAVNSVTLAIASKAAELILNSKPDGGIGQVKDLLTLMQAMQPSDASKMADLLSQWVGDARKAADPAADAGGVHAAGPGAERPASSPGG